MTKRNKVIVGGVLFTLMLCYWSLATMRSVNDMRLSSECGLEVASKSGRLLITGIEIDNTALRSGDEILAVKEFPQRSIREMFDGPVNLRSGEKINLVIKRNNAVYEIPLVTQPVSIGNWLTMLGGLFAPWTFLVIGLVILLLRQGDEQAWLLAMMLGTFTGMFGATFEETSTTVLVVSALARAVGLLFMPLFLNFFLIFPERSRFLQRWPRLESEIHWPFLFVLVPFFLIARLGPITEKLFNFVPGWILRGLNWFSLTLMIAYIVIGMAALVVSYRFARRDTRSKLHLLVAGCSLGTLNLLLVIIIELLEKPVDWRPVYSTLQFLTSITLPLIPISFAYAIVKHQVIPISLMVRRGMRYLFVSRGSVVIELVLIMAVVSLFLVRFFQGLFSFFHPPSLQVMGITIGVVSAITGIVSWTVTRSMHQRFLAPVIDRRFFRQTYDAHQIMTGLTDSLRTASNQTSLLREVATKIQWALNTETVVILLKDPASGDFQSEYCCQYSDIDRTTVVLDRRFTLPATSSAVGMLGMMRKCLDIDAMPLPDAELALLEQMNATLLLPLSGKEQMLGIISLGKRLGDLPYSGEDEQLLMSIGDPVALAIENSRLVEQMIMDARRVQELQAENDARARELEEARQLQLSMLPRRIPQVPGLDIAVYMKTATEVGGDYYDFHQNGDGALTIAIGDATGHGLKAGTIVTATKSLFNNLARLDDLPEILRQSSSALRRMNLRALYMALTLIRLERLELSISSAGMPPILVFRNLSGTVDEVSLPGMPLGSVLDYQYRLRKLAVEDGDVVMMMSDGFPERFNEDGEMLGYARAAELLGEVAGKTAQEIIDQFVQVSEVWGGQRPPDDDLTFVVVKVGPGTGSSEG